MIKQLKKFDTQTTPFIATKDWHLLNVQHQDLILVEVNSETPVGDDTFVSLEFIDYSFDSPYGLLNTDCNIALEQQDSDPVIYEEGISGSGLFYPDAAKNLTGTYKRLMYNQILRAFYNNYHNPLQIFGIEQLDFQTSGMQRYLSDYFRVFTLPQLKFGDKIAEGSVQFVDNTFDDNYTVIDDCQGNLIASPNLFSRIQEIRDFDNIYVDGTANYLCPDPVVSPPTGSPFELTASLMNAHVSGGCQTNPFTASLNWTDPFTNEDGFYIFMATLETTTSSWSDYNYALSTAANVTESLIYYNSPMVSASFYVKAFNMLGTSSASNISNINITCSSGLVWNTWTDNWENLTGSWETYV